MATARRESDDSGCSSWIVVLVVMQAVSRGLQSCAVRENAMPTVLGILGGMLLFAALNALPEGSPVVHPPARLGGVESPSDPGPAHSPMYDRDLGAGPC